MLLDDSMNTKSSVRKLASTLSIVALSGIAFAVASGQSQSVAAPAPQASESASLSVGRNKVDVDQYVVEMKAPGAYTAGQEGVIEITMTGKNDFHINPKYPVKFKATDPAPEGVSFRKALLKREDGDIGDTKGSFKLPFTASKAGKAKISGTLSVSFCNDRQCLMEKLDLDTEVDVKN